MIKPQATLKTNQEFILIVGLWWEEKPQVAREKPLGAEQRNNKFSPEVALSPHSNSCYICGRRMHMYTPLCQHIAFVIFIITTSFLCVISAVSANNTPHAILKFPTLHHRRHVE